MDEWESVRKKIKDLEKSILDDSGSVADLQENTSRNNRLWGTPSEIMPNSPIESQQALLQEAQGIQMLNHKLSDLIQQFESARNLWEGNSKSNTLETEYQKKETELKLQNQRISDELQKTKTQLETQIKQTQKETQTKQQSENEKTRIENELKTVQKKLQDLDQKKQSEVQNLMSQKRELDEQIQTLRQNYEKTKIEQTDLTQQLSDFSKLHKNEIQLLTQQLSEQFKSFESWTQSFTERMKTHLLITDGTLQEAQNLPNLTNEFNEYFKTARQYAGEIFQNIEDFLSLTEIPHLQIETLSAYAVCKQVIEEFQGFIQDKHLCLHFETDRPVPHISADPEWLKNALKNIFLNAIEFSPEHATIELKIDLDNLTQMIKIEIHDQGPGISENLLPKIFNPYFTTKKNHRGLGLTWVQRAMDLIHGKIQIESLQGRGVTATLFLPQAPTL